ncbi:CBS domain-containing protein [Kushneria aurantia]|uniref:CBS domain-containing protein n=1 Tax=Kushneria aurantia TaxID=504092 RepID=A0ABV6G4B7_9GAMM|nr:CBS domain-containing protein [Kushneria aurantia]
MDTQPSPWTQLPLKEIDSATHIARPGLHTTASSLSMESPALELLTDFLEIRAWTVNANESADVALQTMRQNRIHMLLVINGQGKFTGVVSARILFGGNAITRAMQDRHIDREDVTVDMLKLTRDDVHAVDYARLERATVGDLVLTLRTSGDRHVLVTDHNEDGELRIRGVISAREVSHALGIDLDHPPEAHSFSAIRSVVLGHDL